jgi:hypothetical protein
MTNTKDTSPKEKGPEFAKRHAHISEKALHLRIVEEFLTQLEFTLLKAASNSFDFKSIKLGLRELKTLDADPGVDRLKRVEFQLAHELLLWQENLAERDAKIEAYHIRRYCDGLKRSLDPDIFVALARFYRDLPRSGQTLSKFDLAMTRAFSEQKDDLRRRVTLSRAHLVARITELFSRWDKEPVVNQDSQRDVQIFDRFVGEGDSINEFQSLTNIRLFDRIREFKAELGERFYEPAVAAAALECNIAVGNRLNILMARASESLGERLGSEFDFAGAFQDTSRSAGNYISEVLRQIDEKESLITESEDLRFLRSLLDLAATVRGSDEAGEGVQDDSVETVLSTARPEFRNLIGLLSQQNPDTRDIRKYLDSSDSLKSLYLHDFLFLEDDSPDELSREVLKVILSLEEIRANELHGKKDISPDIRNEVMLLLAKAEDLGAKLGSSFDPAGNPYGSRQLLVANKLLETRLRVERSIVRFTSQNLHHGDQILSDGELSGLDELSTFSYIDLGATYANRWVVAATIAVVLISAVLFFSAGTTDAGAMLTEDVEIMEPSRLPGGKDFTSAHRQGTTLYIIAKDAWRGMSDEQKTEGLKLLVDTSSKKLETVVVMDGQGQLMADLTESGVNISKEPIARDERSS